MKPQVPADEGSRGHLNSIALKSSFSLSWPRQPVIFLVQLDKRKETFERINRCVERLIVIGWRGVFIFGIEKRLALFFLCWENPFPTITPIEDTRTNNHETRYKDQRVEWLVP